MPQSPLIPRQVLFGNPEKASPEISPDGTMLAYLAPDEGVLNVWVRSLRSGSESRDDRPVTADRKRGVRFYEWQQDSRHILYMQDVDGDENWHVLQVEVGEGKSEVGAQNLAAKVPPRVALPVSAATAATATPASDPLPPNTRDLTPYDGVQAGFFHTDPNFPEQALVGLNLRDRSLHDIYRLDLHTGKTDLDTENPGDVAGWTADNQMQIRAAEAMHADGSVEIRVRDNAGSPWRTFVTWGPDESFGGIAGFTADDRRALLISSVDANAARLLEVDLATGAMSVIAEDQQYDVSGIMRHPRTHQLEAVLFVRERREWQLLDPSLESDFAVLRVVRPGEFSILSRDLADRTWVVAYDSDTGPVYYYLYDRATRQSQLLFSNRPQLERYQLAAMQPIKFTARDGMTIYGYLTLPNGVEPKNLPLVVDVHGGPWVRDAWGLNNEVQWLANRGYAVLQVNYRGSTGYGKRYLNAGDREWAAKMHTDLIDGKNWAVSQGYADAGRAAIYGGSYGGYAALVGVTFTPGEFTCAVDAFGPANLSTLIRTVPPYWATMLAMMHKRVGNPDTDQEFLDSRSPVFKADQIRVPLMVVQGANDVRVKITESDQIVEAARNNGKEVEYLVFPDEGHGFARPENRLKYYAAVEQFLAKYLDGRAEPATEMESIQSLLR
jgi:dipeptidyl aminopeptidase/acylaminoacyl peptidase